MNTITNNLSHIAPARKETRILAMKAIKESSDTFKRYPVWRQYDLNQVSKHTCFLKYNLELMEVINNIQD